MIGYVSIHRKLREHWLFKEKRNFSRFEAWIDILYEVNHKDNKFLLGNELVEVERGSKITSLRKLSEKWGWSITKVNSFLELLESDKMLVVKKDTKKTLLTVVNYDLYQSDKWKKEHESNAQKTLKEHGSDTEVTRKETNNNDNNDLIMGNNENNDIYRQEKHLSITHEEVEKLKDKFRDLDLDYYIDAVFNHKNNKNYKSLYLTINNWIKKDGDKYIKIKKEPIKRKDPWEKVEFRM